MNGIEYRNVRYYDHSRRRRGATRATKKVDPPFTLLAAPLNAAGDDWKGLDGDPEATAGLALPAGDAGDVPLFTAYGADEEPGDEPGEEEPDCGLD